MINIRLPRRLPPAGVRLGFARSLNAILGHAVFMTRGRLEKKLRNFLSTGNIHLVSQGRAALTLSLRVLNQQCGKKNVVIPAYTCFTVPAAIRKAGMEVLPVDIDPKTLDFDYNKLEKIDWKNSLAIIPSSLYGIPANLERLERLCKDKGVYLIDDAAQSFGAKHNQKYVGTFGDVGIYSMSKGKSFTTLEGGAIVVSNVDLEKDFKNHMELLPAKPALVGLKETFLLLIYSLMMKPRLYWAIVSLPGTGIGKTTYQENFSLCGYNHLVANIGSEQIDDIDNINSRRVHKANYLISRLEDVDGINLIHSLDRSEPIYIRFPIIVDNPKVRNDLENALNGQGLGASVSYPDTICSIEELGLNVECANAEYISKRIITLPTHDFVKISDLNKIISVIKEMTRKHK